MSFTERESRKVTLSEQDIVEWVDHQSWRCEWPDRYPQDEDCPCGLLGALKELGVSEDTIALLRREAA